MILSVTCMLATGTQEFKVIVDPISEVLEEATQSPDVETDNAPTVKEDVTVMKPQENAPPPYTAEELDMMSRVIYGEYGMDWAPDEVQQLVGLVVLNHVKNPNLPNTLREVIFRPGAYSCTRDGNYNKQPSQKAIENAKKVLSGTTDITCPPNVIYQSGVPQGSGIFLKVYDEALNVTTYFCYE